MPEAVLANVMTSVEPVTEIVLQLVILITRPACVAY